MTVRNPARHGSRIRSMVAPALRRRALPDETLASGGSPVRGAIAPAKPIRCVSRPMWAITGIPALFNWETSPVKVPSTSSFTQSFGLTFHQKAACIPDRLRLIHLIGEKGHIGHDQTFCCPARPLPRAVSTDQRAAEWCAREAQDHFRSRIANKQNRNACRLEQTSGCKAVASQCGNDPLSASSCEASRRVTGSVVVGSSVVVRRPISSS